MGLPERSRSLLELNLAVLLWGGTALFAKWIPLSPAEISAARSVVAAVVLWGVLRFRHEPLSPRNLRDLLWLVLIGLLLTGHWVTYFLSMQLSTVAVGILALHTYPVMTALVEPLVFRQRLRGADVTVAGVVLAGIAVLVPEFSLDSRTTQGVLWGVLSAALFTGRNLLSKWLVRTYPGSKLMFYQLITGTVVLSPFLAASGSSLSPGVVGQVVLLGVVFTALPQTLFTNSLQHLSAKTVSVMATLLPVYGTLLAALLLGEIPTKRTFLGGAIILAAVFYETWATVRR